jgi:acetyl esterase
VWIDVRLLVCPMPDVLPLDPGMRAFGEAIAAATPPGAEQWPLDQQRAAWNGVCRKFRTPHPANIEITEVDAYGISTRLYRPSDRVTPGVIYSHGGGWVLGGFDTHDDMCAELAAASGCTLALFDYRRAPEHPFPAQLEDTLKVWRWIKEQGPGHGIDPSRIIAAGDSCGGQMSVALALTLRDLGLQQVDGLLLIYPTLGTDTTTPSYVRNATSPSLSRAEMEYYLSSFLGPKGSPAWSDPKAVPSFADVTGLPSTAITVAAHDPLQDDGLAFARKLQAAGVPVELRNEPTLGHSYMRARHHSPVAMAAFEAIAAMLRKLAQVPYAASASPGVNT